MSCLENNFAAATWLAAHMNSEAGPKPLHKVGGLPVKMMVPLPAFTMPGITCTQHRREELARAHLCHSERTHDSIQQGLTCCLAAACQSGWCL